MKRLILFLALVFISLNLAAQEQQINFIPGKITEAGTKAQYKVTVSSYDEGKFYISNVNNKVEDTQPTWEDGSPGNTLDHRLWDYELRPFELRVKNAYESYSKVPFRGYALKENLKGEILPVVFYVKGKTGEVLEISFIMYEGSKLLYIDPLFLYYLEVHLKKVRFEVDGPPKRLSHTEAGYNIKFDDLIK